LSPALAPGPSAGDGTGSLRAEEEKARAARGEDTRSHERHMEEPGVSRKRLWSFGEEPQCGKCQAQRAFSADFRESN
jgi:hypothetical protein